MDNKQTEKDSVMNIKQVEDVTGVTRQNIRFYERQGLLHPTRNEQNDYREYTGNDVHALKTIKLLRKLKMPIEQIQQILSGSLTLDRALQAQLLSLQKEQEQITSIINFCRGLEREQLETLDVDEKLSQIEKQEQEGAIFGNILGDIIRDFQSVARSERKKQFYFEADNLCLTPQQITEALQKYACQEKLNLVITKGGMYPEFTIDGVEYEAARCHGLYNSFIECRLKHPEDMEPADLNPVRRRMFQILWRILPPILLLLVCFLLLANWQNRGATAVIACAAVLTAGFWVYFVFPRR